MLYSVAWRASAFHRASRRQRARPARRQAKTSGRSDDNPETIQKRISLYAEASKALTDRLLQQGLLHTINAEQSPDDVWSCAQEVLHNELDVHIRNQAVVILKPHACNADAERFVKSYLASHNVAVVKMGRLSAEDLASRSKGGLQASSSATLGGGAARDMARTWRREGGCGVLRPRVGRRTRPVEHFGLGSPLLIAGALWKPSLAERIRLSEQVAQKWLATRPGK